MVTSGSFSAVVAAGAGSAAAVALAKSAVGTLTVAEVGLHEYLVGAVV